MPNRFNASEPSLARLYDWMLGGKDNYIHDRSLVLQILETYPELLDEVRANEEFRRRAVRWLVGEAGVRQLVDLRCGLPTRRSVHDVAHEITPDVRVLYVDDDPMALAHSHALRVTDPRYLGVVTADIGTPQGVLTDQVTRRLIDFDQPFAFVMSPVGQHLDDDDQPWKIISSYLEAGSGEAYLAFSQPVTDNCERAADIAQLLGRVAISWRFRTASEIDRLLSELEPVGQPSLSNVVDWMPDEDEPDFPVPEPELRKYLDASQIWPGSHMYGGVLRRW